MPQFDNFFKPVMFFDNQSLKNIYFFLAFHVGMLFYHSKTMTKTNREKSSQRHLWTKAAKVICPKKSALPSIRKQISFPVNLPRVNRASVIPNYRLHQCHNGVIGKYKSKSHTYILLYTLDQKIDKHALCLFRILEYDFHDFHEYCFKKYLFWLVLVLGLNLVLTWFWS